MSDKCGCDDGIGMFVCSKHSTPENDVFHNVFHRKAPAPPPDLPECCGMIQCCDVCGLCDTCKPHGERVCVG